MSSTEIPTQTRHLNTKIAKEKSILVVDDNPRLTNVLTNMLNTQFSVYSAESFQKAAVLMREYTFDMFIIDIQLGETKSGFDVCFLIKNHYPDKPILFLTGRVDIDTKIKAFEIGADDYLCKPFNFLELKARVLALMRRNEWNNESEIRDADSHEKRPEEEVYVRGITLLPNQRIAMINNIRISFRKKEFEILLCLAKNKGKVVSRETLAYKVWGDSYVCSNTIDVHIKSIRKKLANHDVWDLIKTVPCLGYTIDQKEGKKDAYED